MKHPDYYNMMVQVSGLIHTDDNGNSVCTVCHGTGKHYEASVKHHKGCKFIKAIEAMQNIMPDKITPQVENQITLGMMLSSISDVSSETMNQIQEFLDCMTAAEDESERSHVAALIQSWCSFVKDEILDAVVDNGLPDDNAVQTFRNYLIFEYHNMREMLRMALDMLSFEKTTGELYPKFKSLLCGKYPHYAQTSKKD